jgi:hypothetical protein
MPPLREGRLSESSQRCLVGKEGRKGIHLGSLGRRMSVVVAAVAVAVEEFCFMIELVACRGWHCVFL